ncbi:MAG: hypothetical protein M1826_005328 [Phylliscum demangeonii]|nr:MAG: hypothetical protein M1826_005328 [Phylliscum demangeonii]
MTSSQTNTAQPSIDDAYTQPGNAVERTPQEIAIGSSRKAPDDENETARDNSTVSARRAGDQGDIEPQPPALAAGSSHTIREEDEPAAHDRPADTLDGEQMTMLAEGDVARAQEHKTGTGEQPSLTSDLERQKREQQEKRDLIKEMRREAFVAGGAAGQQPGPAAVEGR